MSCSVVCVGVEVVSGVGEVLVFSVVSEVDV